MTVSLAAEAALHGGRSGSAHALPYHPEASGGAGAHDSVLALPWGQARRRGQLVEEHRTLVRPETKPEDVPLDCTAG